MKKISMNLRLKPNCYRQGGAKGIGEGVLRVLAIEGALLVINWPSDAKKLTKSGEY